jgi:hypothetical protein
MLYITCDSGNQILDICSDTANVGAVAQAALAAGGHQYQVAPQDFWVGDHYNGTALTKDSPGRAAAAALDADNTRLAAILNGLGALQSQFETDVGGALTAAQIAQWRTSINGITTFPLLQTYEKRLALFIIDALIYLLRRVG